MVSVHQKSPWHTYCPVSFRHRSFEFLLSALPHSNAIPFLNEHAPKMTSCSILQNGALFPWMLELRFSWQELQLFFCAARFATRTALQTCFWPLIRLTRIWSAWQKIFCIWQINSIEAPLYISLFKGPSECKGTYYSSVCPSVCFTNFFLMRQVESHFMQLTMTLC